MGWEGSSSKSFKAIIMIKGDEEMEQRRGKGKTKWKDGVEAGRGEKKRIP